MAQADVNLYILSCSTLNWGSAHVSFVVTTEARNLKTDSREHLKKQQIQDKGSEYSLYSGKDFLQWRRIKT